MLDKMTKEELVAEFKRITGNDAKTAWSKAELIEEIEKATAANSNGNPPAPPAPELPKAEEKVESAGYVLAEGEFIIVKEVNGKLDRQVTNKEAWNLLPDHKFGWKREVPAEVN